MKSFRAAFALLASVVLGAMGTGVARAQWTTDGALVSATSTSQRDVVAASDGAGGAIIAWTDSPTTQDVFAQRLDPAGVPLWGGGAAVTTSSREESVPAILPDGGGGVIIAFQVFYVAGNQFGVSAQRLNASGMRQWPSLGAVACTLGAGSKSAVRVVTDGAGGAIVTWTDGRAGTGNNDIYGARITAGGARPWGPTGVALCTATGNQNNAALTPDGMGGAIAVWVDQREGTSNPDVYAQRVDGSGAPQWAADGVPVAATATPEQGASALADGAGGAFMAWTAGSDALAQRLDALGTGQWVPGGVALATVSSSKSDLRLVEDAAGGFIATWQDMRNDAGDIYAQRVNSSGTPLWNTAGVRVCGASGAQLTAAPLPDGVGGALLVWHDSRGGASNDLYAQRVSGSAALLWHTVDGVAVCRAAGNQTLSLTGLPVSDGAEGLIVAWADSRAGNQDVYAQRMVANGNAAFLATEIAALGDLPGDQGGWLRMSLDAPQGDVGPGPPVVTGYNVWRRVEAAAQAAHGAVGDAVGGHALQDGGELARAEPSWAGVARSELEPVRLAASQADAAGFPPGTWESLGFHAATQSSSYLIAVPTRNDSTAEGTAEEVFLVSTHTTSPSVYGVSNADSGWSVDNLAPAGPSDFTGTVDGDGLHMHWSPNTEQDLAHYRVYEGSGAPPPSVLLGTTTGTAWDLPRWSPPPETVYYLTAVDRHGNESPFVPLDLSNVGVGQGPAPLETHLGRVTPNPFVAVTVIEWGLSRAGHARLRVYDAGGRRVRTLVHDERPAGRHAVHWDGRDDAGRAIAGGVYFVRLEATGAKRVRRVLKLE